MPKRLSSGIVSPKLLVDLEHATSSPCELERKPILKTKPTSPTISANQRLLPSPYSLAPLQRTFHEITARQQPIPSRAATRQPSSQKHRWSGTSRKKCKSPKSNERRRQETRALTLHTKLASANTHLSR